MPMNVLTTDRGDQVFAAIFRNAGAPTNNVTFLGVAVRGDLLSDTTNANLYMCTVSTATTITWAQYTHA
jgi:hypothetical protein